MICARSNMHEARTKAHTQTPGFIQVVQKLRSIIRRKLSLLYDSESVFDRILKWQQVYTNQKHSSHQPHHPKA